jgi:DnaJ family protein C protein 16
VLLFTDKKTTPAIFKSLSKKFLDKLVFGEVRHTEAELVANFKVTEFPTLLVVTDIETLTGDKYSGDIKVD